ncbi:MAG: fumarylacetoacetase [Nevskia sp.]|nr:fumarylacetoacetase [Nevskia sp.]
MSLTALNSTHDPQLRSWLASANAADADFPIQNLPFGVFRRRGSSEPFRGGVAIGDAIVDLGAAAPLFAGLAAEAAAAAARPALNALMALGAPAASALRAALSEALRQGAPQQAALERCLAAQAQAEYAVPAQVGDYTDFYASIHHATAVGRLMRPDQPLLPNYKWIPVGYHGRSSSIVVSGQGIRRPCGQTLPQGMAEPVFGPSRRLDYELELGLFVGQGNALGTPVPMAQAESHLFGVCLLNDWSARDIQGWEYQPLGPFLAKNFATTVSPWIVSFEALAPFRLPFLRPAADPQPLPYLDSAENRAAGAIDIRLEVLLESAAMRSRGEAPWRLSTSSYRHSYWTAAQLLAHHTVNGCNLRPGDLLGSGTQSGPAPEEAGCLLELTQAGRKPVALGGGETRSFLQDGDRVILRGWCEKPGAVRIGFGEAAGEVLPALAAAT